jgi:large subunit ribosomal protein L25
MITLQTQPRTIIGKKVKSLRKKGFIPAVIYGHKTKSRNLFLRALDFQKVYKEARSNIVELVVNKEKPVNVLIQDIQTDPLTDKIIHIDFHQVEATEKVTTEIELKFIGESKAVKELNGILVKNLDKIKVESLSKDLIHKIEVDLSKLTTFDDVIYVSSLKIPETIKVLEKSDEAVALVQPPRIEEVIEEKPEEKIEEVERIGEKKEEVEEKKEEGRK